MDSGTNKNNIEHNKIENLIVDEDADDQNFEANLNANTNYLDNNNISKFSIMHWYNYKIYYLIEIFLLNNLFGRYLLHEL